MPNYEKRLDYLVGKLIDGAKAIDELFERAYYNPSQNIREVARRISQEYELTKNQKRVLERLVYRLNKAIAIVESLKKEYGMTKAGDFRKKRALYKAVYRENPKKSIYFARPYSFAIGFYLQESNFRERVAGDASSQPIILKPEQRKLLNIKSKYNPTGLSFRINYKALNIKTPEEKSLIALFGPALRKLEEKHELKHIIDTIIESDGSTAELSAELFTRNWSRYLLLGDYHELELRLRASIERYESMKLLNTPQFLLDNEQKISNEIRKRMEQVKDSVSIIKEIINKGLDAKSLSYIVAMTDFDKLEHRLNLIRDHLGRYPLKHQ